VTAGGEGPVRSEKEDGVRVLTVHRPEKLNALNSDVLAALDRGLAECEADTGLRCVIVTGSGEKAFIAGADIGELSRLTPIEGREHSLRGQALLNRIANLTIPSIAAINGYAYGGGLELAMACTLRVASENARMGLPETSLGILPGYGGTQRLARLVGRARAFELILTSEKGLTAQEAERIGLVNRVVPAGQALAAARELAGKIAANGPAACRYAMEAIRRGLEMPLAEGQAFEATLFGLCAATEDMKEGMTAFLEKRPPKFAGR
jgi:enoyl-CoA hydratase